MKGALALGPGILLAMGFISPAHAQTPTVALGTTSVAGGTLGTTTVTGGSISSAAVMASASALKTVTLKTKDGKTIDIKSGDKIENLQIDSATVASGAVSGGKWPSTTSATLDLQRGTITLNALNGTALKGVTLTDAKVSAGAQSWKLNGKEVSADLGGTSLDLLNVNADSVNLSNTEIPVSALQLPQAKPTSTTEAADISLVGDYFVFNTKVEGFGPSQNNAAGNLTAPKGACFRVSQELERKDPADPTKTVRIARGSFATGFFPHYLLPPWWCASDNDLRSSSIESDTSYDVLRQTILDDRDRGRFGWTYGVLVAPFKFYYSSRNFSAGATVGPYLGYRFHDRQGSSSVIALAIGATSATVKTNNPDGTTTSSDRTGLSMAFSYLLDIKRDFNMGFLAGKDFFSKADAIPNSGKLWLGVSFGRKIN
jgi:hypothetical protein